MQKFNLREQLINSTMDSLKIDKNPFNYSTIEEYITHIKDENLKKFYSMLFGDKHTYLSGMDRVKVVADEFAVPDKEKKSFILKKISLIEGCNHAMFNAAEESGRTFEDQLKGSYFPSVTDEEIAYFNSVKPYCDFKELVTNINQYENSAIQYSAFENAFNLEEEHGNISLPVLKKVKQLESFGF